MIYVFLLITIAIIVSAIVIGVSTSKRDKKIKQMKNYIHYFFTYFFGSPMPDDIKQVYNQASAIIDNLPRSDLKNVFNDRTVKKYALNIIQNCALVNIKSNSVREFLFPEDDNIFELYTLANDVKFSEHLISKQQHKENMELIVNISTGRTMF